MLISLNEFRKFGISATDGAIGAAKDFLFDVSAWEIRYLVVDTGNWLPGRLVLISPTAVARVDSVEQRLQLNLSQDQIEQSPPIDAEQPVSRQRELELARYYRWPRYWGTTAAVGISAPPVPATAVAEAEETFSSEHLPSDDPNLRSVREVINYEIQAIDGPIGHVEDLIGDPEDWKIRYVVVDTRSWKWLPGGKVLVTPEWVYSVDWRDSAVHVDLRKNAIKNSPEYDPGAPVNRQYEARLFDYYGRPKYW